MPGAGLQQPEGLWQHKEPRAPELLQFEEQPQSRNLLSSSCPDRAGSFPPAGAARAFRFGMNP